MRPRRRTADLAGRVALVTGAARGIGAALAERLARRGARVALAGLEPEHLRRVERACGPDASSWEVDVTDWDGLRRVVAGVVGRYGSIDVVVANAGIAAPGFIRSIDPEAFERVVEVDLLGTWRTVRTCLPHLVASRGYCLVVSSMAAAVHLPGMAAYSAAKAGVEAFANTLRAEVGHLGVGVGVAHPSWIATDMVAGADEHPVFGPLRRRMPAAATRTYPLALAAGRLEAGVARRARTIHVPRSMAAVRLARGFLPGLVERAASRTMPAADVAALEDVERRGAAASAPVGPGGAAAG
jgi:NAD(P)-dependent dehydrogenase (short-subunit alcohol dehydrogenase family)